MLKKNVSVYYQLIYFSNVQKQHNYLELNTLSRIIYRVRFHPSEV